jgi:membrane protease YdiL (CAAX protease family)
MSVPAILANFAVLSLGLTIIVACPIVWANIVRRLASGEDVVPFEPRRRARWVLQFAIILAVCLTLLLVVGVYSKVLRPDLDNAPAAGDVAVAQEVVDADQPSAEEFALRGLSAEIMILFVIAGVLGILCVTSGATLADFGLDFRKLGYDVHLGVLAFAAISVPTYALQALLHTYVTKASHPVTEALAKNREPSLFLAMFALAVFLAPLAEELIFRVLLQGWIEALLVPPPTTARASTDWGQVTPTELAADTFDAAAEQMSTSAEPAPAESNAAEPPDTFRLAPEIVEPMITRRISWLPILVTSALFALSHLGNGPSAVPLFFFGLALGYLYQQTHRLAPSLVLHMSLNGFTMLMVMASPVPN